MREISYSKALAEAMDEEMARDERVFLIGIDIGPYGGAFGATKGLYEKYPHRTLDMPISEAGYTGAAVGAAMTGMRPVVELQFSDWITIASDQLVNQAANIRYLLAGKVSVPLVLRAPVGGYLSAAAQHSHMFESWFSFIPGLKVVLPSTPYDAKGLLKSAIRDDNPVIFFEHKQLYEMKGEVPQEEYTVPLGKAEVKREGEHLTIVTYSLMVQKCLEAAQKLASADISVEVVDLRTVSPIDGDTILNSVKKTGRILIVQETWARCSVSSEVAAIVADQGFDFLDSPIRRVTAKEAPNAFSPRLENYILPQVEDIVSMAKSILQKGTGDN